MYCRVIIHLSSLKNTQAYFVLSKLSARIITRGSMMQSYDSPNHLLLYSNACAWSTSESFSARYDFAAQCISNLLLCIKGYSDFGDTARELLQAVNFSL